MKYGQSENKHKKVLKCLLAFDIIVFLHIKDRRIFDMVGVGWSIYGNGRDHHHDFKVTELISKTSSSR